MSRSIAVRRSTSERKPRVLWRPRAVLLSMPMVVFLFVLATAGPVQAQAKRIELSDLKKLVSVSDPQISPDGKSIVCVVSHMNFEQDRHDAELVLIDIATGSQRPLTFERKRVGSPRWSPAGDRLAFLAAAPTGKDEQEQLFILPMNGGDAVKLTDASNGIQQFAWRPGRQEIAYVTSDEPSNKKEIEAHNDAFEVGDDDFLNKAAPTSSHIWLISADGGKPRRLTSGSWSLPRSAPPSSPASPISWSPDGRYISFAKQENPHYGDSDLATIQILDVASGEIRKLTKHEKLEAFGDYSPDGSQITYWYPRDGDPNNENEIYVAPSAGGDGADLTRALDRDIQRAIWMPAGKSLLVGGHDGTRVALWIQPLDGKAKRLNLGDVNPSWLFWVDVSVGKDGAVAFSGSAPNHPNEIYYLDSPDAEPRRLTDFNHDLAALSLGRVEELEWQGPDGFREDGVVIWPPEFDSRKEYPLVLAIHGGPTSASTLSFTFLTQLLASHDYIVFLPNYRGSDNLGNAYQRAIYNDAGAGPGRDVMAGIEALEKMGHVDKSKIAVSGWSYGGYMTSWMIGHYHIWKAAVAGASVTDMVHAYNLSDFNVTQRYAFGGSPWVGNFMKAYREQSPISYAANIKTPTLVLSDTADARVPITQSYFLYHAMKDNGVTVQFFAYPVPGHFPGDPVRTTDVYRRWVGWIDQYLK